MKDLPDNKTGYSQSHPWYYVLGGRVLSPAEIQASVELNAYSAAISEDILKIAKRLEPQRSEGLRELRGAIKQSLQRDIDIYLKFALKLKASRQYADSNAELTCNDIHVSMSLKHNHLCYGYARLMNCEDHLNQKTDLFAFL